MNRNNPRFRSEDHVLAGRARAEARCRQPRCLDTDGRADPRRDPRPRERSRCRARRHRHGALVADAARGAVWRGAAQSSFPEGCSPTSHVSCRRGTSSSSTGRTRACSVVRCGPAEYRLNTFGAEDFPRLPDTDAAATHTVDADSFLATVASVGRAVSRDEARPVLTGVLVKFGDGKLVMAATDSYRLSYKETPMADAVPELEAIVPARALDEVRRLASSGGTLELGRAGEPGAVRDRRHLADHSPNRRAVPEVRGAPPEGLRARCRAAEGGTAGGRPEDVGHGAPQLSASPALQRGGGDGLDADAGCRRGARVAAGPVRRRAARDRVQRGFPPRRDRIGRRETRCGCG